MRLALSIAGSDPTGGAGIQSDLQVFRHFGVHGMAVLTALTAQDTRRVRRVLPVFPNVVLEQLRVLLTDLRPHALKLGMLASDDVLRSVELGLEALERPDAPRPPLVVDPILLASDGTPLLERRAWGGLGRLIAGAQLVTPNLSEAAALTGRDTSSRSGVEAAARALVVDFGCEAALVKGGHAEGPADDLLALRGTAGCTLDWLAGERIAVSGIRGTGCALSAAITAQLALGSELRTAVETGRRFLREALERCARAGDGQRLLLYG